MSKRVHEDHDEGGSSEKPAAAAAAAAAAPAGASTTRSGENFIRTPLETFEPPALTMGLPGLGKVATEQLKTMGYDHPAEILGLYMSFGCDGETFLQFLEKECRVVFRGNSHASADEMKRALCDTLLAKWNVIKNY